MLDTLYLYGRYLSISIRSQMQYRASFVMLTLGHMVTTGLEFVAILVLFDRFGTLAGWKLHEVAFIYGVVNISFAFADAMSRGFDSFGTMVKSGDFDRLLTRPRSTALQLAGQELTLRRVGRLAQGLIVLVWASVGLEVDWSALKFGALLATVAGGACLFVGLIVLQATLAFWTTETLEIMNTVTYGGVETTQYPITIYSPWFRRLFTFGDAGGVRELLPVARDHGGAGPARVASVVPVCLSADRSWVPGRRATGVEVRGSALCLDGELGGITLICLIIRVMKAHVFGGWRTHLANTYGVKSDFLQGPSRKGRRWSLECLDSRPPWLCRLGIHTGRGVGRSERRG